MFWRRTGAKLGGRTSGAVLDVHFPSTLFDEQKEHYLLDFMCVQVTFMYATRYLYLLMPMTLIEAPTGFFAEEFSAFPR